MCDRLDVRALYCDLLDVAIDLAGVAVEDRQHRRHEHRCNVERAVDRHKLDRERDLLLLDLL